MNNINLKLFLVLTFTTMNCFGMLKFNYQQSKTTSSSTSSNYSFTNFNGQTNEQYSKMETQHTNQGPITNHTKWAKNNGKLTTHTPSTTPPPALARQQASLHSSSKFNANLGVLTSMGVILVLALYYRYFMQDNEEQTESK